MARIIGKDALPLRQQLTLLCADLVNEAFLRQSAFSEIDRVCCPARQGAMMRLLGRFIDLAESALAAGVHRATASRAAHCVRPLQRMGEEIGGREPRARSPCSRRRWSANSPRSRCMTSEGARCGSRLKARRRRLEGPLLFLRRTLDVGLSDAVEVRGTDGRARLGRIAAHRPATS